MATIIDSNTLEEIILSNNSKKIGIGFGGISSRKSSLYSRVRLHTLYNFVKMKSLSEITICCPLSIFDTDTEVDMLDVINENLSDFLCDYVFLDPLQFNILGNNKQYSKQYSIQDGILDHFVNNNYIFDAYTPYDIQLYTIGDTSYKRGWIYTPRIPFFNPLSLPKPYGTGEHISINTMIDTILEIINIETSSLEDISNILEQHSPFYEVINIKGNDATISDLREGKVVGILYPDSDSKANKIKGSFCWFGFGQGDIYNEKTEEFTRNVCDTEIDTFLNSKWGRNIEGLIYNNFMDIYYPAFREDIKTFYNQKYNI